MGGRGQKVAGAVMLLKPRSGDALVLLGFFLSRAAKMRGTEAHSPRVAFAVR